MAAADESSRTRSLVTVQVLAVYHIAAVPPHTGTRMADLRLGLAVACWHFGKVGAASAADWFLGTVAGLDSDNAVEVTLQIAPQTTFTVPPHWLHVLPSPLDWGALCATRPARIKLLVDRLGVPIRQESDGFAVIPDWPDTGYRARDFAADDLVWVFWDRLAHYQAVASWEGARVSKVVGETVYVALDADPHGELCAKPSLVMRRTIPGQQEVPRPTQPVVIG